MTEQTILIATCGSDIALYAPNTENLLSDAAALAVAEELVRRLSSGSLQLLGCTVQETLNKGLGHTEGHC